MGLFLLNLSIDSADPNPEHIPEDLSINDQESIVELVVEKILGFEDAIKEYDDHDNEENNKGNNIKIELLVNITKSNNFTHNPLDERKSCFRDYEARITKGFTEIVSPPPKI